MYSTRVFLITCCICTGILQAQIEESSVETGFAGQDSISYKALPSQEVIVDFLEEEASGSIPVGGIISSVFREAVDSARVRVLVDGKESKNLNSELGWFFIPDVQENQLLDIFVDHPDFHTYDTSIVITGQKTVPLLIELVPKYKILLRGRVFAGNVPLAGAEVKVIYEGETTDLITRDCYFDEDNYWNCLYHGMFKTEITTEEITDSIRLLINYPGMETREMSMSFDNYRGEVMEIQMRYGKVLPAIPTNSVAVKLSFPFASVDNDWFVNLSYHRLLNESNLRRIGFGMDVNAYITLYTVEHETFQGLGNSTFDSSYVSVFAGPSMLFYITKPERRYFNTYAGCTFSWQLDEGAFVPQPFLGTRVFLDLNKSLSLEIRYADFEKDIKHYNFNYYGDATAYIASTRLQKLSMNIGVQVVF